MPPRTLFADAFYWVALIFPRDTFHARVRSFSASLGPARLVTTDEVKDPQDLEMELKVNGEVMQSANTSEMIVGCTDLVEYLSQFMRLLPGDIVTTGTPAGIGAMRNPPRYLASGDVIEASVAGLGFQRYTVG